MNSKQIGTVVGCVIYTIFIAALMISGFGVFFENEKAGIEGLILFIVMALVIMFINIKSAINQYKEDAD